MIMPSPYEIARMYAVSALLKKYKEENLKYFREFLEDEPSPANETQEEGLRRIARARSKAVRKLRQVHLREYKELYSESRRMQEDEVFFELMCQRLRKMDVDRLKIVEEIAVHRIAKLMLDGE